MVKLVTLSHPQSIEEVQSPKTKAQIPYSWACPCRMQVWLSPSAILTVVRDPVIVVVIIDSVSETIAIRVVITWEMEIVTNMALVLYED